MHFMDKWFEVSADRQLANQAEKGGITLVLGAGVSISRGIPNWDSLAQDVWHEVFGGKNDPWFAKAEISPKHVPQFLPIAFELVYRKTGEAAFIEILRRHLYKNARYPADAVGLKKSDESLAVIAKLIIQEHQLKSNGRIDAVITFNADDFIEQAVQKISGTNGFLGNPVRVFARSTHSLLGGPKRLSIPIYHVHGYLPSNRMGNHSVSDFNHMLVFTDTQYWATSASGSSFANRIMASSLGEGCCVFIGLSMTDINLLRWFALRTFEMDKDMLSRRPRGKLSRDQIALFKRQFERHFWIRPDDDDPTGFLSVFLLQRGIKSVAIESWKGASFRKLIERCFS
jgi:hypothetical protein